MPSVAVIETGAANTASVSASLRRCGCDCVVTTDRALIRDADRVILPGVGSFGSGMAALRDHGLDDVVRDRVRSERPTLAVCLGLQLLCTRSEESPGVEGLGLVDAAVQRLPAELRVPQFGWNMVDVGDTSLAESGYAYYANSYCIAAPPLGWRCATSTYGIRFVAAIERGPVLACQFHPELSGRWGASLLRGWLRNSGAPLAC